MEQAVPEASTEETYEAVGNEVTIETEECEAVVEEAVEEEEVSEVGHVTHAIIKYEGDGTEVMEVGEDGREHIIVAALDSEHQVVIETVEEIQEDGEIPGNVMYVSTAVGAEAEDSHVINNPPENYEEYQRPVRPVERQKMRPWLMDLLDKGNIPGLNWQNRSKRIFRISWKHAAHNCFNKEKDSDLFERWAYHTGRHHDGNHKRWKANFRCALNSLPDVIELRDLGVRKGDNAFKVYKFIDLSDKSGQEEKKRQQVINAMTLKSRAKGSKQSKSDTEVIKAEGMLQTLLHAIELKTQEAQDEDSPTTIRARGALKRTLVERGQQQAKRRKETLGSDDEDNGSVNSQDSSQEGVPTPPVSESGTSTGNIPLQFPIITKTEGKGPGGKAESVITVPASLLSNLGKGISIAPSGQIPYGISTSGRQIIPLSTLLASLGQQSSPKKTQPGKLVPVKLGQKEGTVPKTVFETLKVVKSESASANSEEKQSESSPLEINKDWTSLAAALKSSGTVQVKPSHTEAKSQSPSLGSASSPNIRSKLVTWLNDAGQPVKASATVVRLPAPHQAKTTTNPMERVIIRSSSDTNTLSSRTTTTSTETTVAVSSPSAVVQRVEQLGDITVNIGNLDSDETLVGSGPGTPQSAEVEIPIQYVVTSSDAQSTSTTVGQCADASTTAQSDGTTEISADIQSTAEDGTQQDIYAKQITIDLGSVNSQVKSGTQSGKDASQQLADTTQGVINISSDAEHIIHNVQTLPSSSSTKSGIPTIEASESILVTSQDGEVIRLARIGDTYYTVKEEDVELNQSREETATLEEGLEIPDDLLQQAMHILSSSPVYRTFSYKLIKNSKDSKSLIINNNWYFGILGEYVDPLTVTLTSSGQLTLSIIFKPVQKMSVERPQGDLDEELFRSLLDQMTRNRFCPGIPHSKILPECNMKSIVVLSHPFLRYQSMDCPVWFDPTENSVSTVPVHKCPSCHELCRTLGKQVSSIKRKKRKQEEQGEIDDEACSDEVASIM